MKLENKTILITGASSGLGRALALRLSHRDNNLVVTARRENKLRELKAEVETNGSRCTVVPGDATDLEACRAVVAGGIEAYGRIDVAVLNAGGGKAMSMADASAEEVMHIMRMNYDTFANFLCLLIDHMKGHPSIIAHTGSPAGYFGLPNSGPYSASKAAGRVLLDTCRIELAGSGIRFVGLYPGFTQTEGFDPNDVPIQSLIIDMERASKEMMRAVERETSHHMFPKRIKFLILLARFLPEPIRRRVLGMAS